MVRISLKAYFKRIDVIGSEYLEEDRVIFVSNHPGAMMDPLIVAIHSKKPLHFIAGAEWFGDGFKSWLFRNQFNMIPVYRPWLKKDGNTVSNEDMFQECYRSLEHGKRIIIYPEASSRTVPWIRELKTGAARIKIGADKELKEKGKTKIIPIGINYVNPHRFRTRATIVVGKPIDFDDLLSDDLDDKERAVRMTDRIKEKMKACVLHIEEEEHFPIIRQVFKLMMDPVKKQIQPNVDGNVEAEFYAQKAIISAVEYYKRSEDDKILEIEVKLKNYIEAYERLGFRAFNPFEKSRWYVFRQILLILLAAPIFIVGCITNAIPLTLSYLLFKSLLLEKVSGDHKEGEINPAFAGSLAYVLGLAIFMMWYTIIAIASTWLYTWWVAIPVAVFLSFHSGRISLFYLGWLNRLKMMIKWWSLPESERNDLLSQRAYIQDELEALKLRFINES